MRVEYLYNEKGERVDTKGNRLYKRKPAPKTKSVLQRRREEFTLPADSELSQQQVDDKLRLLLEDRIRKTLNPVKLREATRALKKLEIEIQRRQERESAAAFEQTKQDILAQTRKEFPPLSASPEPTAQSIKQFELIAARYDAGLRSLPYTAEYKLSRTYLHEQHEILTYSLKHARHAKETADHHRRLNEKDAINREVERRLSEDLPAPLPAPLEPAPASEHYWHPIDPPLPLPKGLAGDASGLTLPAPAVPPPQKRAARYEDLFRDEFLKKEI